MICVLSHCTLYVSLTASEEESVRESFGLIALTHGIFLHTSTGVQVLQIT